MKLKPMFYVADVNGTQLEAYDFTTYGPAAKRARELSIKLQIETTVGVCLPSYVWKNGRAQLDV